MCKKLRFARWINKARAFRASGNDFGDSAALRVNKVGKSETGIMIIKRIIIRFMRGARVVYRNFDSLPPRGKVARAA